MLNQYLMQETFRGAVFSVLEEDEAQAAYEAYELFQEDLDAIASEAAELKVSRWISLRLTALHSIITETALWLATLNSRRLIYGV